MAVDRNTTGNSSNYIGDGHLTKAHTYTYLETLTYALTCLYI